MPYRDDDLDGLHPGEFPDGDTDDDELADCPYCGERIYEGSEQCAACGQYISAEDAPPRRPWWIVLGLFVCLVISLGWALSG
jgi:hypothetical protein